MFFQTELLPESEPSWLRAWTTGVSNPFCSPRFRISTSGKGKRAAFAFRLPPGIYEFYLSSGNSTLLSLPQALPPFIHPRWSPGVTTERGTSFLLTLVTNPVPFTKVRGKYGVSQSLVTSVPF